MYALYSAGHRLTMHLTTCNLMLAASKLGAAPLLRRTAVSSAQIRLSMSTAADGKDFVHLKGLRFHGHHGVLPEETEAGQTFLVDATLLTDLRRAGETDDLRATVNYAEVFSQIRQIVEGPPCKLLETVGERISKAVLERHSAVKGVQLYIRKPHPPITGTLESVGVEITRHRKRFKDDVFHYEG